MCSFLHSQVCGLIHTLKLNSALRDYAIVIVSASSGGFRYSLGTIKCKISLQQQRALSLLCYTSAMGPLYWISKLKRSPYLECWLSMAKEKRVMVGHTMAPTASVWKWPMSLLLIYCWTKRFIWSSLISGGKKRNPITKTGSRERETQQGGVRIFLPQYNLTTIVILRMHMCLMVQITELDCQNSYLFWVFFLWEIIKYEWKH